MTEFLGEEPLLGKAAWAGVEDCSHIIWLGSGARAIAGYHWGSDGHTGPVGQGKPFVLHVILHVEGASTIKCMKWFCKPARTGCL